MDEQIIIFINADDPPNMEIAEDEVGNRLVFNSYEKADNWCADNAEPGATYMFWNGTNDAFTGVKV